MDIRIHYEPNAEELVRTSSLFLEKKPIFFYGIGFLNIAMFLLLAIMFAKLVSPLRLNMNEWIVSIVCIFWLFGRKRFNEWLLYRKMLRARIVGKPITIDISYNGIIWSGKGLSPGDMTWEQVKYVFEVQNGFIFPDTFTRFLWVPFRGFESPADIDTLKHCLADKKIKIRAFKNVVC